MNTTSASKEMNAEHVESLKPVHTYLEQDDLSSAHQQYLMERHGTIHLDPIPDMNDADPYNWKTTTKVINLSLVAFHAMMSTFTAASIQSAFVNIAADLQVSIPRVSYLVSLFIAILGVAPFFWRPLSNRYGRRPIFLISLVCSLVGNVGCALSHSYASMAVCRAITAFFISPAAAIGSAVVAETFFKKDRARAMGVWTLLLTIGVPISPFIFGFVALRINYRWIYYILAMTNGVQLILYLFLGPETRYLRSGVSHAGSNLTQRYFAFTRIDPTPLTLRDFLSPLHFFARPCVLLPAISYSMIFLFGSVLISIEIPQIFPEKFNFNTQQVGLQFAGLIIGGIIGEQIGGLLSDRWMLHREKSIQHRPEPEYRLWLSYIGHLLTICGVVVFLVQLDHIKVWNVTPIVGTGIAAAGTQIVTTIMITYAVDCYREEAASVGVFITLVRQTWGFIGPFWFPKAIASIGLSGSAGLMAGMMVMCSIFPTVVLLWAGRRLR